MDRFDHGNELWIDLAWGTLVSVSEQQLFSGANAFAIETAPGVWEIVQAANAELVSPGRYRLTKLLRGVRGTEWAMTSVVASGATVVMLDEAVIELPISAEDVGVPWYWRVGPASKTISDAPIGRRNSRLAPSGWNLSRGCMPCSPIGAAGRWAI